MWFHKRQDRTYMSVALAFIIVGAIIFTFGGVAWLYNILNNENAVSMPALKIIGGLIVMALGYIQLELGLIRDK